ncbi:MAG: hypothetical protein GY765_38955, partial [bacterium]|nr:hypothetical protein [bacterium]
VGNDISKLQELKMFTPGGFLDLSDIAADKGIIQVGARSLTARYMEQRLVKSAQKTNWAQPKLTRKQQIYAACDAWICLEIYPLLLEDKTNYKKLAEEEEQALEQSGEKSRGKSGGRSSSRTNGRSSGRANGRSNGR